MTTLSNKILSVSELTYSIKSKLESSFPNIQVQGEISNFKAQSSGHLYFTLKDSQAQISCVMFKGYAKSLARMPKIGDQVTIKAEISVYPPRGGYQLVVKELTQAGVGELLMRLHALKEEFKTKGYFDPAKKKPLPKSPKKILVVTSPTGAVIQDILNVLKRRSFSFELVLNPVKVQGPGAAEEIAKAIKDANTFNIADVMIVGRGGGSMEDLWPFNERAVVEEIFSSNIPVVSAVGHESDFTLADLVSDLRAPTPSAAAELVSEETLQQLEKIKFAKKRVCEALRQKIAFFKEKITAITKQPLFNQRDKLLSDYYQKIDEISNTLDQRIKQILSEKKVLLLGMKKQAFDPRQNLINTRKTLENYKNRLDDVLKSKMKYFKTRFPADTYKKNLELLLIQIVRERRERFDRLLSHLKSINPENLLEKGYAMLFLKKDNSIILSIDKVAQNDQVYARLKNGSIHATIDKTERK